MIMSNEPRLCGLLEFCSVAMSGDDNPQQKSSSGKREYFEYLEQIDGLKKHNKHLNIGAVHGFSSCFPHMFN